MLNHKETIDTFEELIKYLKLALKNLCSKRKRIEKWLIDDKSEATIEEIETCYKMILGKVLSWYELYKKTNNFLSIKVSKISNVIAESAYIQGETLMNDDIHSEIIDWLIGDIGITMKEKIKKGEKYVW